MNKYYLPLLIFLGLSINSIGQTAEVDTSWKKGGFFGVTFNQVGLTNWVQGGDNSVGISARTNLFANYLKGKVDWQTSLDMAYAMVQTGNDKLKKNDDKIDLTSKYSRKFSDHWLYGVLFNFKSQFAEGFNYPDDSNIVSKFFSPAYITLSPGITWKPLSYFEVLVSPITAKWTFVNDKNLSDAGAYGVEPGKTMRSEYGTYLNLKFQKDIMENTNLMTKLELFNNFSDKGNSNKIDVNWEVLLAMKVNKFLTASVNTILIYDADIIERTQFKEAIGVGFGYKF